MVSLSWNTLFCVNAAWKIARAVDISDVRRPKLIQEWKTEGNPGRIITSEDLMLVPEGHGGLVVMPAPSRPK